MQRGKGEGARKRGALTKLGQTQFGDRVRGTRGAAAAMARGELGRDPGGVLPQARNEVRNTLVQRKGRRAVRKLVKGRLACASGHGVIVGRGGKRQGAMRKEKKLCKHSCVCVSRGLTQRRPTTLFPKFFDSDSEAPA